VRNLNPEKAESLSPELQAALEPLLNAIESLSERIVEYNERIENLAQQSYPQVALLKQIKGVGALIALTFLLTLEDPHRFGKSRDVGIDLGLRPGRRNSGQSEPQMHISKEGDPYLRTLLVQGAQHILGPFGVDCDLRRWGLKLAAPVPPREKPGHGPPVRLSSPFSAVRFAEEESRNTGMFRAFFGKQRQGFLTGPMFCTKRSVSVTLC
jgi:hypothetical protein